MSFDPKVIEQGLINLCKLAEHQKKQRPNKLGNKILRQTLKEKLAQIFSLITEKITETENY